MANKTARLGDLATYINGYAFKPADWGDTGLPIIRIQDLTGNSYQLNRYDGEYPERIEVNDGDVLISWSASLGVYVWQRGKALLNQHIFKVVFDKLPINKDYFVFAVEHKLAEMESKTHGATMKHIVKKDFDGTTIPYPSSEKQAEIADHLRRITSLIDRQTEQLLLLDQLVKSRFIELFGDPLSNDKGWQKVVITEVCHAIFGGGTPSKSHPEYFAGSIPWISPKDMKSTVINDSIDHITEEAIAHSTTNLVPANSVLMVIRSGILKHTLPVAINSLPVTINQDMKAFVPNETVKTAFLMHLFKAIENDVLAGVRGVTADNIDFKAFQKRTIIVPPLELQEQFAAFVEQTDKSKLAVQKGLQELEILKKSLMQQYFG